MKTILAALILAALMISPAMADRKQDEADARIAKAMAAAVAATKAVADRKASNAEKEAKAAAFDKVFQAGRVSGIMAEHKAKGVEITHEQAVELANRPTAAPVALGEEIDRAWADIERRRERDTDRFIERSRELQRSYENDMLRMEIRPQTLMLMNTGRYPNVYRVPIY